MSGSFNVVFCVCTSSTGLWYNTRVCNGIDTVLEPKLEVRQGPCGSMKERTWEAVCRKTHTLQQKGRKAGLVALPLAGAVISRVRLMCSVEQVIYRVARDPNSLNVVRELVFQTFSNELWDTTLKIQLPQRDIRHKSKLSGVGGGVRDPPEWKRLAQVTLSVTGSQLVIQNLCLYWQALEGRAWAALLLTTFISVFRCEWMEGPGRIRRADLVPEPSRKQASTLDQYQGDNCRCSTGN